MIANMLAQVTAPQLSMVERWVSGKEGVLGLSLILNIVLFNIAWYLLRLMLKKETERNIVIERFTKEILENMIEVTKAITELSTIIKGQYNKK